MDHKLKSGVDFIATGIDFIAAERERQISSKGWTLEQDEGHQRGELIDAAQSYIRAAVNIGHPGLQKPPQTWPWEPQAWKPEGNSLQNLVKAGALIAAEIDRQTRSVEFLVAMEHDKPGFIADCATVGWITRERMMEALLVVDLYRAGPNT